MSCIKVTYESYGTTWHINEALVGLHKIELLAFDIETKGVYTKEQRAEAVKLLGVDMSTDNHKLVSVVANNSGLSFPSLIEVTHFVFGLSESHSVILITPTLREEMNVWNWIRNYPGKLLIHNTMFDLKVMYHRIGCLPHNYEDTALLAKTLINNSDSWKAKIGLKDLMAGHYDPKWALFDEYEPSNLKNPAFLSYAAIDGAATFKLWTDLQRICND